MPNIKKKINKQFLSLLNDYAGLKLPGARSHLRMAPEMRRKDILFPDKSQKSIDSAVLIAFYPESFSYKTVLIKRPDYDGVHSGQIAFPGGRREKNEELYETALREAKEEVGIDPDDVKIITQLTPLYIPPSKYMVYPFVGILDKKPSLVADRIEVAEIFEIDLNFFLDRNNTKSENIQLSDGAIVSAPCYNYDGKIIWGATAMIMCELVDLIYERFN